MQIKKKGKKMFGFNNIKKKFFKKAEKISKKGGGASPKNKVLINYILTHLSKNNLTPEDLEKELKEGKGKNIINVLAKGKNLDQFFKEVLTEVKKEYYKKEKK
jgi:hypothetical protein